MKKLFVLFVFAAATMVSCQKAKNMADEAKNTVEKTTDAAAETVKDAGNTAVTVGDDLHKKGTDAIDATGNAVKEAVGH